MAKVHTYIADIKTLYFQGLTSKYLSPRDEKEISESKKRPFRNMDGVLALAAIDKKKINDDIGWLDKVSFHYYDKFYNHAIKKAKELEKDLIRCAGYYSVIEKAGESSSDFSNYLDQDAGRRSEIAKFFMEKTHIQPFSPKKVKEMIQLVMGSYGTAPRWIYDRNKVTSELNRGMDVMTNTLPAFTAMMHHACTKEKSWEKSIGFAEMIEPLIVVLDGIGGVRVKRLHQNQSYSIHKSVSNRITNAKTITP